MSLLIRICTVSKVSSLMCRVERVKIVKCYMALHLFIPSNIASLVLLIKSMHFHLIHSLHTPNDVH